MMKFPSLYAARCALGAAALSLFAAPAAIAQESDIPDVSLTAPDGQNVYGSSVANVRKATAIVNGEVITGSDVDERLALLLNNTDAEALDGEQLELARQQVLSNLVDETLQIQEAEAKDIVISDADIDRTYISVAQRNGAENLEQFAERLRAMGSSPRSLKRQIKGEIAWQRLLGREVSPFVNVGDEEVNSVIERLMESQGSTEVRLGEIYLSATPETAEAVSERARQIVRSIEQGGSFAAYATQFSQASTASRGGDLGWVRPEMLPESFLDPLSRLSVGQIAGPVPAPGGLSILYLIDRRQVLGANSQDTQLSLKQIFIDFDSDMTDTAIARSIERFAVGVGAINGCGDAENVAAQLGADVISRNDIRLGDLPGPLQSVMGSLPVGQATPPYGSPEEGVRAFILCGRDAPESPGLPSAEQVRNTLEQDRIDKKARIYLRDLRQDAIIRYN